MNDKPRRFYSVSPDGKIVAGFDFRAGAETAAVAFGDGAHVIDTASSAYQPAVSMVEGGEMVIAGYGSFDARDGLEKNLIEAIKKGFAPTVRAFLAKGADANAVDANGGTALIWAAAKGSGEIAAILIEAGADVNKADHGGMTPLKLAEKKNKETVAALLRDAGAH